MAALNGEEIPQRVTKMLRDSQEVRKHLIENKPIKHEGVLTYSLERTHGGGEEFERLRELVRVGEINTDWMEHWYSHSSSLISERYRDFTSEMLKSSLGEMDAQKIANLENWENSNNQSREEKLSDFVDSIGRKK